MKKVKIPCQIFLILVFLFLACLLSTPAHSAQAVRKAPKTPASPWQKLSDRQIARMFFPKEKLYFQPTIEGLPMLDPASLDGVNVYGVKRLVANFDNDPENELAVQIEYSTGMCTSCRSPVLFAILNRQHGKIEIAWRNEESSAFDEGNTSISSAKLIKKDKFFELVLIFDTVSIETGNSRLEMRIIRWDGKKFATIWRHDLESHSSGGRGGIPHDYLAKVDFLDDKKEAKRIKVASIYATHPRVEEPEQYVLREEFEWDENDRRYWRLRYHGHRFEKNQECVSYYEPGRQDYKDCRKIEPGR